MVKKRIVAEVGLGGRDGERRKIDLMVEMPPYYNPDMKVDPDPPGSVSLDGLKRDGSLLGTETINGVKFWFWISKTLRLASVTSPIPNSDRHSRDSTVYFKDFSDCDNTLQVNRMFTQPDKRGFNLMSSLYLKLAANGYSILSDLLNNSSSRATWKKVARNSDSSGCRVLLFSPEENGFISDDTGKVVQYNAQNVDDALIWVDMSEPETLLLVLTKNK